MTATQLGFDALARETILARVLDHADNDWKREGLTAIAHLAATGRDFQATDLIALGLGEPDHPSRWGGLFVAAARAGLIEHAGYAQSHRPTVQGSVTKTWRGTAVRATTNDVLDIKALSLARPWARLVIDNGKNIENRTWVPKYRGLLVIHASQTQLTVTLPRGRTETGRLDPTGFIGVVELLDVCRAQIGSYPRPCGCGIWAQPGLAHWKLSNPRPLPRPIPAKGRLGLFMPPLTVVDIARNVATR